MRTFEKKNINVIYDNDLISFLKKINIYDDVIFERKKCKFTGIIITLDNFYSIFKIGGDIKFVSDKPLAIKMFSEYLNDKK